MGEEGSVIHIHIGGFILFCLVVWAFGVFVGRVA